MPPGGVDPRNSPKFWDRFAEGFRGLGVSRFAFRFRVLDPPCVVCVTGIIQYKHLILESFLSVELKARESRAELRAE